MADKVPWQVASPTGVVPLGQTLRQHTAGPAPVPWFAPPPPPPPPPVDQTLVAAAAEAREELAYLRETLDEARAAAIEEGRAAGRAAADALGAKLEAAAAALTAAREALAAADAERVVDVALAIAQVIARKALAADHGALAEIVREALAAAGPSATTTLRANPDDVDAIANNVPPEVIVVPDDALAPGEVRVEAERAVVDATIKTRLENLRERLVAAVAEEP